MPVMAAAGAGPDGVGLFAVLVLLAGSLAVGLFLAAPLRAPTAEARRSPGDRPWSTGPATSERPDEREPLQPWSTSLPGDVCKATDSDV